MKYLKHLLCMVLIVFSFWFLVQLRQRAKEVELTYKVYCGDTSKTLMSGM